MAKFNVVINGKIEGIRNHRFAGNNGIPERYETTDSQELQALNACQFAFPVEDVPEKKAEPEQQPSPEAPEIPEEREIAPPEDPARAALEAMDGREIRQRVKGKKIIKQGMTDAALIDEVLKNPELVSKIIASTLGDTNI